jgi:hypothetical protein
MRNLDSKIYLPRFYRFKFRFHSFFAETFSTVSVKLGRPAMSVACPLSLGSGRGFARAQAKADGGFQIAFDSCKIWGIFLASVMSDAAHGK